MVEDLITALSRYQEFAVVARNPPFVTREKPPEPLGVCYALGNSMRRLGDVARGLHSSMAPRGWPRASGLLLPRLPSGLSLTSISC